VQFPVRTLAGFERETIPAGATKNVTIHVAPCQLEYGSTQEGEWLRPAGKRTFSVGASSRDLRLEQVID
jgi:beta-glucosidase